MKKVFSLCLCLFVLMGCFMFPYTEVEAYPTNNGEYSIDYVNDLNTKYGLVTESELISMNVNEEATLDFVLRVLARLHYLEGHYNKTIDTLPNDTVKYCIDNGIFDDCLDSYDVPLTRGAFTYLLINAIQNRDMLEINNVSDGAIPDIEVDYFYKDAVYKCYRYGLICGVDSEGTFITERPITVYEVFVVLNRVMNPNLRQMIKM